MKWNALGKVSGFLVPCIYIWCVFIEGGYHEDYPPNSDQAFSEGYQSTPSSTEHHSSASGYSLRGGGRSYHHHYSRQYQSQSNHHPQGRGRTEGNRGAALEPHKDQRDQKEYLLDSGGYVPDSAESGSTDADTYDNMQVNT